jgi:hypothetical protein
MTNRFGGSVASLSIFGPVSAARMVKPCGNEPYADVFLCGGQPTDKYRCHNHLPKSKNMRPHLHTRFGSCRQRFYDLVERKAIGAPSAQ